MTVPEQPTPGALMRTIAASGSGAGGVGGAGGIGAGMSGGAGGVGGGCMPHRAPNAASAAITAAATACSSLSRHMITPFSSAEVVPRVPTLGYAR